MNSYRVFLEYKSVKETDFIKEMIMCGCENEFQAVGFAISGIMSIKKLPLNTLWRVKEIINETEKLESSKIVTIQSLTKV